MYEVSEILICNIDKETLAILVTLIEQGCDPMALATLVNELKKQSELNNN